MRLACVSCILHFFAKEPQAYKNLRAPSRFRYLLIRSPVEEQQRSLHTIKKEYGEFLMKLSRSSYNEPPFDCRLIEQFKVSGVHAERWRSGDWFIATTRVRIETVYLRLILKLGSVTRNHHTKFNSQAWHLMVQGSDVGNAKLTCRSGQAAHRPVKTEPVMWVDSQITLSQLETSHRGSSMWRRRRILRCQFMLRLRLVAKRSDGS